jgi:hypothetical protein
MDTAEKKLRASSQFTDIPGYDGLYRINQFGDILRVFKTCIVPMKPTVKKGQYIIRLMEPEGKRKEERVHKLMQRTFFPKAKPGYVFYHKNGDKMDNWLNNLGYISRQDLGRATGGGSRRKPVVKINVNKEVIEHYSSAREAARENYMSYQTVMDLCNGKVKRGMAPDGFIYVWDEDFDY